MLKYEINESATNHPKHPETNSFRYAQDKKTAALPIF